MSYNPGVTFFISFYELDPSTQDQCIYFTQKGARCGCQCQKSDNSRAIALHRKINAIAFEGPVDLGLLREYVLSNCCRWGRAKHRDRIEDVGLLGPLAERWRGEIWERVEQRTLEFESAMLTVRLNAGANRSTTTPIANTTPYKKCYSSSDYQDNNSKHCAAISPISRPVESQQRYNLRSSPLFPKSTPADVLQKALSEFRPHVKDPKPYDSVLYKIRAPLKGRDKETGSLYIFDRASSPGHVKIGWTAKSVTDRLTAWSKCGYTPNLLVSVNDVPHAQRVETLTHYELVKEWRRERMCKAPACGKSHQEWFEVERGRAKKVLATWVEFMMRAEPYDCNGLLKYRWRVEVDRMERNGEVVTGRKLLDIFEKSLVDAALVKIGAEATQMLERRRTGDLEKMLMSAGLPSRQERAVSRMPTLVKCAG